MRHPDEIYPVRMLRMMKTGRFVPHAVRRVDHVQNCIDHWDAQAKLETGASRKRIEERADAWRAILAELLSSGAA